MNYSGNGKIMMPSGCLVDPLALEAEDVCIEDIAHRLAMMCRFGGSTRVHYSVAQHSVEVSQRVPSRCALAGLLHDAAEAYLWDVSGPYKGKVSIGGVSVTAREHQILRTIFRVLDVEPRLDFVISDADARMLSTEARDFMPAHEGWASDGYAEAYADQLTAWPWDVAERIFLERFHFLKEV